MGQRKDFGVRGASVLPMAGGPCVAYSSLARMGSELQHNPPDAIIVMLGTNDARLGHWNAEAFKTEYCLLLQRLIGLELESESEGSRRLVLIAVPPRVMPNSWGIDVGIAEKELGLAVAEVAQKMRMPLLNLREALEPAEGFVADGVHLNQAGSALVAELATHALLEQQGACLLRFAAPGGMPLGGYGRTAPTGVKVKLPDSSLEKSYSPVSLASSICLSVHIPREKEEGLVHIYVESFSHLAGAPLRPGRWDWLGLVAAGTGLAPLLQVAVEVLSWKDSTRLSLVLACRSEDEILMREDLEKLAQHPSMDVSVQLSRPGPGWPPECSGRLSKAEICEPEYCGEGNLSYVAEVAHTACNGDASAHVGRWEGALALLASMRMRRVCPNVVSYSAAVSACEKKGEWQHAMQLLETMREHEVWPNDITCNSAISSCELCGQWLVAVNLLESMSAWNILPDVISFNSALSSCEWTGFWQMALSLVARMQQEHLAPNIRTCNSVIHTFQTDSQWQRASSFLSFMKAKVVVPDVTTCSRAIESCERGKKWQLVAGLVCSLQEFNMEKMLKSLYTDHSRCQILVCGTDGFVDSIAGPIERTKLPDGGKRKMQGKLGGLLAELGYSSSQVHKF
ncbi:unnamed protein product [Symbiodinium pilosum]|uniref:Cytochrome-b5 reductase n=1 Tax=Symbiodinium pilosum TaxID=2952 RepID=A0A812ISD6_SYMPI|nr:unnamed protein product [Symbiodinium pilosum]